MYEQMQNKKFDIKILQVNRLNTFSQHKNKMNNVHVCIFTSTTQEQIKEFYTHLVHHKNTPKTFTYIRQLK